MIKFIDVIKSEKSNQNFLMFSLYVISNDFIISFWIKSIKNSWFAKLQTDLKRVLNADINQKSIII